MLTSDRSCFASAACFSAHSSILDMSTLACEQQQEVLHFWVENIYVYCFKCLSRKKIVNVRLEIQVSYNVHCKPNLLVGSLVLLNKP